MKIKLAKTAGFCMGVRRAIDIALKIAKGNKGGKIYTYGPLIHNPQAVDFLIGRGIIPISDMEEIAEGEKGSIIIRAHGISPGERRKLQQKGMKIVDATCPRVKHVQSIIKKHSQLEFSILIIGDRDHPEVEGLLGYAGDAGLVVGSEFETEKLPQMEKTCVVAQTTQSRDAYLKISQAILREFPESLVFNTICDSTEKRQAEMKCLAAEMDAILVVGGRNSANTKRLASISKGLGVPTFHIESASEIREISINGYNSIGVSAGASTPNWVIREIVEEILNLCETR